MYWIHYVTLVPGVGRKWFNFSIQYAVLTARVVDICRETTLLQYHWLFPVLCPLPPRLSHSPPGSLSLPLSFSHVAHPSTHFPLATTCLFSIPTCLILLFVCLFTHVCFRLHKWGNWYGILMIGVLIPPQPFPSFMVLVIFTFQRHHFSPLCERGLTVPTSCDVKHDTRTYYFC